MEQRIIIEGAYHAKIKLEIYRVSAVLGGVVFPCGQSVLEATTYGYLKENYPIHYLVFHRVLAQIQKLRTGEFIDKEEINYYIQTLNAINKTSFPDQEIIPLQLSLFKTIGFQSVELGQATREEEKQMKNFDLIRDERTKNILSGRLRRALLNDDINTFYDLYTHKSQLRSNGGVGKITIIEAQKLANTYFPNVCFKYLLDFNGNKVTTETS